MSDQSDTQPESFLVPLPERENPSFSAMFERPSFPIDEIRSVRDVSPGVTFEQVHDTYIERLRQDDPRIDVIHVAGGLEDAVATKLDSDFAGEELIALRSIQASLDGLVSDGSTDVHDIRDILRAGEMQNRKTVNLAGFKPGSDRHAFDRVHHRVVQYAMQTDFFRDCVLGGAENSDRVFPVILVYDHTKLSGAGGNYRQELPKDELERASIIRKAYVLDTMIREPLA